MRTTRFLLLLVLPMLALAGCGKEGAEPQTPGTNDTGAIKFEIGFAGQDGTQTRVATAADFTSAFEDDDQIGIFAVVSGEDLAASGNPIHNVPLTYDKAAGTWSGEAYWPDGVDMLDFYAYYPYDEAATDPTVIAFNVKADQSTTADYGDSDLLAAYSNNNGWAEGEIVNLTFTHMLSMVQLTIDAEEDGIDFTKDVTVTLQGVKTVAHLDLSAGTTYAAIQPATGDAGNVTMYLAATDGTKRLYRALVPAQTVASGAKLFRIENGGQTLTSDALTAEMTLTASTAELFTLSDGGGTPDPDIDDVLDKIPDANFRAAVTELMNAGGWDANTDGKLSPAEAAAVTGMMDVSKKDIASLAGIEYFTALTVLRCSDNDLDALDVSKNTALTELYCGDGSTELTVTVDAEAHDISTDGNLEVRASNGNGGAYTRIIALNTETNGVTVTAGGTSGDPQTIIPASLTGLIAPATGAAPTAAVPETDEWTATPAWMVKVGVSSYVPFTDDAFAAETEYSVDITLTAKAGWQFAIDPGITDNTEKVAAWFEYMEDFVPAGGTLNGVESLGLNTPTTKTTVTITVLFPATGAAVPLNSRITWKDGKYALTTDPTDAGLYFKFGSVAGIYSGDGAVQTLPATNSDAFDAGDIAWNPTGATDWAGVPVYSDYPADIDGEYHTAANVKAGKGDPCRLVGLDLDKIKTTAADDLTPEDIDNGEWRLPTNAENQSFSGYNTILYTDAHWTTLSGVNGGMFPDTTNGNEATFLPAAGGRNDGTGAVQNQVTNGYYWSATPISATNGYNLGFNSTLVYPHNNGSYAYGYAVRCVRQ